MLEEVPLTNVLIVTTVMFFIGVYGFLTRKNLITMLISIELMLNAVNLNFVFFDNYLFQENWKDISFHFLSSLSQLPKRPWPLLYLSTSIAISGLLMWRK